MDLTLVHYKNLVIYKASAAASASASPSTAATARRSRSGWCRHKLLRVAAGARVQGTSGRRGICHTPKFAFQVKIRKINRLK